ncbi:hypothetical protein GTA07_29635 [Rhodococcus hoagii]|nr:hypothetical protein [Prescottella equi]
MTPSDFPLAMLDQPQLDALGLPWADVQDLYTLAHAAGMLFHSLLEQQGGDYINQLSVSVQGLAPERFREALAGGGAAARHIAQRVPLARRAGQPLQWVRKQVHCHAVKSTFGHDDLDCLTRLADAEREQGFDLAPGATAAPDAGPHGMIAIS